jgi:hypothetical protein
MAEEKGYQGWKNYETWNIALWINNDQGLQSIVHDLAREITEIGELATAIKDMVEESNPLQGTSTLYTDLLQSAIDEADFWEIATAMKEDVAEGDTYREEPEEEEIF